MDYQNDDPLGCQTNNMKKNVNFTLKSFCDAIDRKNHKEQINLIYFMPIEKKTIINN